MFQAEIQTRWIGDGSSEANPNRPSWADEFAHQSWQDVTGQEPHAEPNTYTLLVRAEQSVVEATEASPDYWVNWAESIPETDEEVPAGIPGIPMQEEELDQPRFDAMRSWQSGRGFEQRFLDETYGAAPGGRKAKDLGKVIRDRQRIRHKKVVKKRAVRRR